MQCEPCGEAVRSGGSPPPRRGADASQRAKWKPQSFVWGEFNWKIIMEIIMFTASFFFSWSIAMISHVNHDVR